MKFTLKKIVAATVFSAASLGMSGCSTMEGKTYDKDYTESAIKDSLKHSIHSVESMMDGETRSIKQAQPSSVFESTPWVSVKSTSSTVKLPLDISQRKVTVNEPFETSLSFIVTKLKRISGLNIVVEYDVLEDPSSEGSADSGSMDSTTVIDPNAPMTPDSDGAEVSGNFLEEKKVRISHTNASLGSLLDKIGDAMQAKWRYKPETDSIVYYRYVTKTFQIASPPGRTSNKSSLSAGSNESTFEQDFSVWSGLENNIKEMTSLRGRYMISEAASSVTIRDTPNVVNSIRDYIEELNKNLSKSVSLSFQVFSVVRNREDRRAINWAGIFSSKNLGFSFDTPRGSVDGVGTIALEVPPTAQGALQQFIGSQGFIDLLSVYGKTYSKGNFSIQGMNNQPSPFKLTNKYSYVKSQTPTITETGVVTSLETDTVEYGMVFQALSSIQRNNKDINLQLVGSITGLTGLDAFSSGSGETVTIANNANLSSREFMSKYWIQNGSSIILTGFEIDRMVDTKQGMGSPDAWAAGGSKEYQKDRETILLVITPRVKKADLKANTY